MKLHLPKRLLAALLATFSVVTSLSSTAWAGWGRIDENGQQVDNDTYYLDSVTTPSISSVGLDGTNYFIRTNNVADYKTATVTTLELGDGQTMNIDGSWDDETKEFDSLTLENVQVNTGASTLHVSETNIVNLKAVSGEGALNLSVDGTLSFGEAFNSSLGTVTNKQTGTINIASDYAGTTTGAIANSGTIVLQQGSNDVFLYTLVGKNNGKYKPSVISNTSTGNLVIENTGNKKLDGAVTIANGGTVTLRGGTFGTTEARLSNTIKTENATFLGFEDISVNIGGNANSNQMLDADIIVGNGATLTMAVGDRYHYANKHTLKVLSGGSVVLGDTRQTLAQGFIVELAGGTITGVGDSAGMALDFYNGGTIKVTENSTLGANTGGHDNDATITLDVANGKTLTMNGNFVKTAITVSNEGIVVYKGEVFAKDLAIDNDEGVFEYNFTGERTHTGNITGTGTLRKSGNGTLNLSSANTSVTNLAVTGGKLVYTVADGEKTHTLSGTSGTFEKTGAGTLNLGAMKDYAYTGSLTVTEGNVKFAGTVGNTDADEDAENVPSFVTLITHLTTVNDAKVEITDNVLFNYKQVGAADSVINIDDNITITGNLRINSYESVNAPDGDGMRRWNVLAGANLNVGGALWLTNDQKMVVSGGHVTADGGIKLGHEQNNANGAHHSKIVIESGSVTTTGVTFNAGENDVVMSGGKLTFAPTTDAAQVLSGGSGVNRFTVTGGTLKATDKSWALTGTTGHVVSLGNATFDIAADKTVTLSGTMALTGSLDVVGDGTLQVGGTTWNVQSSDLANFMVTGGVVNDSTKVNGLGTYSDYIFIRGNVEQQPDTATSILVDNAATTIHKQDGYWTFTGTAAGAYVIGGKFSTEEAATDTDAVGANLFVVNKEGVFTIAGNITDGKTAKELVMTTLGTGKIKLSSNVDLSHSGEDIHFAGSLDIESGATLTLGRVYNTGIDSTSSNTTEYDINISSLSSLNLNGGMLKMYYVAPHIKSMTVAQASTISIDDVWSDKQTAKADATRIDSLQLDANLSMETNWKSNVSIGNLTGDGNLTVSQTSAGNNDSTKLWIDGVNGYTGNISLTGKVALTLNIGENESLNASQLSVGSSSAVTLTGSGLYDMGSATTVNVLGLTNADNWTGTVKISGNESVTDLNFANYGNENSWVQLIGLKGHWHAGSDNAVNISTNIILGNETGESVDAFTHNNGYSNTVYTISGDVKGTGNLKTIRNQSNATVRTVFTGDVSGWTGSYINANNTSELQFAGDAKDINAAITKTGGKINLTVDTDEAATFSKDVTVSKLTLNQQATFNNTLSVDKATIQAKDTTVGGAELKGVVIDSTGIHGTNTAVVASEGSTAGGSVSNALIELRNAASYSIEDTQLNNVVLNAGAKAAIVELQNVGGNAVLQSGTYKMQAIFGSAVEQMSIADNPTLQYEVAGNWTVGDNAATIVLTADPETDCGQFRDEYNLVFTLNLDFADGVTAPATVEGWKDIVNFGGEMATLLDEQNAQYTMTVEEAMGMENPYVIYNYDATSSVLTVTVNGLTVPEPTTATLSLLALAALAARRRRR